MRRGVRVVHQRLRVEDHVRERRVPSAQRTAVRAVRQRQVRTARHLHQLELDLVLARNRPARRNRVVRRVLERRVEEVVVAGRRMERRLRDEPRRIRQVRTVLRVVVARVDTYRAHVRQHVQRLVARIDRVADGDLLRVIPVGRHVQRIRHHAVRRLRRQPQGRARDLGRRRLVAAARGGRHLEGHLRRGQDTRQRMAALAADLLRVVAAVRQ